MITQQILIGNIPSILWGNDSSRLYLYVHGQGGNKEEASFLAEKICVRGWQVLSFDLPGHGERKNENGSFDPWHVSPEICEEALEATRFICKQHWGLVQYALLRT